MHVLYTATLIGMVSLGFSQRWVVSHPRAVAALPMCSLISGSKDRLFADGGTKVGELVYHYKFVVVDGDDRWNVHILSQHNGLLQADD